MLFRTLFAALLLAIIAIPSAGFCATQVVEGDAAKTAYEKDKATAYILKQKDTVFSLISPGGAETPSPKEVTVKPGEVIFILNEEEKVVHNVYDESDHSWVLKKQEPSTVASISFSEAGVHKLRCAIHPKMKITVNVK